MKSLDVDLSLVGRCKLPCLSPFNNCDQWLETCHISNSIEVTQLYSFYVLHSSLSFLINSCFFFPRINYIFSNPTVQCQYYICQCLSPLGIMHMRTMPCVVHTRLALLTPLESQTTFHYVFTLFIFTSNVICLSLVLCILVPYNSVRSYTDGNSFGFLQKIRPSTDHCDT